MIKRTAAFSIGLFLLMCSSSCLVDRDYREEGNFAEEDFCPADSLYDEVEDLCYVDCEHLTDLECEALAEEVFGEFDEYVVEDYGSKVPEDLSTAIAKYTITNGLSLTAIDIQEPENDERYREIWKNASQILPRKILQESISEYHIDSDGEGENLAYVIGDEKLPNKWIIAYDDADYFGPQDREFTHTTVHEFAHIVFLGGDQLDAYSDEECPTFDADEGCSYESSYINQFYQAFWTDIIDENRVIESEDELLAFYEKYQDQFVSEYAATNPVEDAAEVFTHFVLREKPADDATVVNQKLLLMYNFEALVNLRKEIRGKLTLTRTRLQRSGS